MQFSFKSKLPTLGIKKLALGTVKYGDILYQDGTLIVPIDFNKTFVYEYNTEEWKIYWNTTIYGSQFGPILSMDNDNLIVYDNRLFELFIENDYNTDFVNIYYRELREKCCFPVVNRGKLWYDRLTPSQISELNYWYESWLDVTETQVMPSAPSWLNNKLDKLEEEVIF